MGCDKEVISVLALGGEGSSEEKRAVQVNLSYILDDNFVCAAGVGGLDRLKRAGPVVLSGSFKLPFAEGTFDRIIARGVPVCRGRCEKLDDPDMCKNPPTTFLGEVYCVERVKRLLTKDGILDVSDECWVDSL